MTDHWMMAVLMWRTLAHLNPDINMSITSKASFSIADRVLHAEYDWQQPSIARVIRTDEWKATVFWRQGGKSVDHLDFEGDAERFERDAVLVAMADPGD